MPNDLRRALVEIVAEASRLPAEQRREFVAGACAGNRELEAEVLSLLDAESSATGFLSDPTRIGRVNAAETARLAGAEGAGSVIGRYKLLEQIGEGGFGVVFMAEQREPVQRRVALKIIKLGMDTKSVVARFEAERQALALMDHPNIARVLDGGATPSGRPYFVMELVRGEPIDLFCNRLRLKPPERLELFTQVCHAVQHAHTKGIIHRDIKPGNILVSEVDGRPVPKVIDFGIAKATSARLTEKTLFTEFRQMIGTPVYMSPEQAGGTAGDADTRTDVYSLGVLLYELLTGSTPFDPETLRSAAWAELQRIIREEDPPRPSTRLSTMKDSLPSVAAQRQIEPARLRALVRGDLDWIVMRCLEKDRARRYPTADALAEDVRRHLDGLAVLAAPPSMTYRVRKFARRHRVLLAASACIALALIAGFAATGYGLVRAKRAEKLALERFEQAEKARAEAVDARERAEKSNRITSAVTEFFTQDLLDIGPRPAGEPEVTVRQVLEEVPKKIDRYFKSDPAIEGTIRERVGTLYRRLGELERSRIYLTEAIQLLDKGLGSDSKATLSAIHRLGELSMDMCRYEEAEALFSRAYEGRLKAYGMDYAMTLSSLMRRGAARAAAGRVEEGLTDVRAAVAYNEKTGGRESRNYILAANNQVNILNIAARHEEARSLASELLETIQRRGGNLAPLEWLIRQELCNAQLGLGHGAEALEQAEAMSRIIAATYPPDHPTVVDAKLCHGRALAAQARYPEAAATLESAYRLAQSIYGTSNDYSRQAAGVRADVAAKSSDPDGAELWRSRTR